MKVRKAVATLSAAALVLGVGLACRQSPVDPQPPAPLSAKVAPRALVTQAKIMGLGDSLLEAWDGVTQSVTGGSLAYLQTRLSQAGVTATIYNEGHGGDTIKMADNRVDAIFATEMPDYVFIYLGTNDCGGTPDYSGGPSNPVGVAPSKLNDLINHVLSKSPTLKVIVAQVAYSSSIWQNLNEQTFNQAIPTVAGWHSGRVFVVDMTVISSDYMGDGVHFGWIGYNMMSHLEYKALMPFLGLPAPTDNPFNGAYGPHLWTPTGWYRT